MGIRKWIVRFALRILLWRWRSKDHEIDPAVPWIAAEDCRQGDILYGDLEDDRLYRHGPTSTRFPLYTARRDIRAGELVYDDLMSPAPSDLEFFKATEQST
jgi:hypothetical protein